MFQGLRGRGNPEYTLKNLITPEREAQPPARGVSPSCQATPACSTPRPQHDPLEDDPVRRSLSVRGTYIHASNLRVNVANTRQVEEALKSLDFILACDIMMNPTVEWADIVLPATTWIERDE